MTFIFIGISQEFIASSERIFASDEIEGIAT